MPILTENDLLSRLNVKFGPPEWAFLPQMADGTGAYKRRTIDAVAMNLWPSRGLQLHGFEIKVQRADFLRELHNPKKADDSIGYCDHWWIVAADKDIVKNGELPPLWGLMIPYGKGLRTAVPAPALREKQRKSFDRIFIAGMLRKASERYGMHAHRRAIYDEVENQVEKRLLEEYGERLDKADEVKAVMEKFREASGISVYDFVTSDKATAVGKIVKAVLGNYGGLLWKLRNARDSALGAYEELDKIAEGLIGSIKSEQEEIFEDEKPGEEG